MNEDIYNSIVLKLLTNDTTLTPKIIYNLCFCHSKFTFDRNRELEQNRDKYFKRSQKKVWRLNDEFYEMMIPVIRENILEMDPLDLIGISFGALRPQVKKRQVNSLIFEFNLDVMKLYSQQLQDGSMEL